MKLILINLPIQSFKVPFLSYPNPQQSMIRNVTFITQGPFCDHLSTPQTFVSLFDIKGLVFQACNFTNDNNGEDSIFPAPITSGIGITSIDASFSVIEQCTGSIVPCQQWISSVFNDLYYGIKAENTNPTNTILINKCEFNRIHRGIYLSGVDFPQITSSSFKLPKFYMQNSGPDTVYGLYLNACTGYKVQENQFMKINGWSGVLCKSFIGTIINNSGINPNEIYNNSFNNIGIGILAQSINRSQDGKTGLCLKCNDFNKTAYDQAVTNQGLPLTTIWGISHYQGAPSPNDTSPAGNSFSMTHDPSVSNGLSDINNNGGSIYYYYHQSWTPYFRIRPIYITSNITTGWVVGTSYTKSRACPSRLRNDNTTYNSMELLSEQAQVLSLNNQLNALIDGGNTEATATNINFSLPTDALQIHDDLLSKSPYLSDTVMKSAIIKESVLPNEMIRDILVANPQSAKSDSVLNELDNRFVQMPEDMMDEIMAGKDTLGSKENLEAQIANHQLNETYSFNELVRFYKLDTIDTWAEDSLLILLQNRSDLSTKYILAFEYLDRNENENVTQVLKNIPTQFGLSLEEQQQYQDYDNYFQIMIDLKSQNHTIFDINTDQQNQLMELAIHGSDPVQTYARNALIANNLITYQEPVNLPDEKKSAPAAKVPKLYETHKGNLLKIFPNPAKQYVIIEYKISDEFKNSGNIILTIMTSDGRIVEVRNIVKPQDQLLINCHELSSGSYICKLACGKNVLGVGKFILAK